MDHLWISRDILKNLFPVQDQCGLWVCKLTLHCICSETTKLNITEMFNPSLSGIENPALGELQPAYLLVTKHKTTH